MGVAVTESVLVLPVWFNWGSGKRFSPPNVGCLSFGFGHGNGSLIRAQCFWVPIFLVSKAGLVDSSR